MQRIGVYLSVFTPFVLTSVSALASDGAAKKGLPQLDAASYPDLLFWFAIFFPLLFVLMRFWIVPGVQTTQGNRRQILDADLAASKAASEAAEATRQDCEKALASARHAAEQMVETIIADAAREADTKNRALSADLAKKIEETENRIAAMKDKAIQESPKAIADIASTIVDTLLGAAKKAPAHK